jgi:hypothetical protein
MDTMLFMMIFLSKVLAEAATVVPPKTPLRRGANHLGPPETQQHLGSGDANRRISYASSLQRLQASPLRLSSLERFPMVDRQKLETVLARRFPGAAPNQVAATANAIMGLTDEWEEVEGRDSEFGFHCPVECGDICYFARETANGWAFRLFRRRSEA